MSARRQAAGGATVLETTVVIVILGVVLSILMPAVGIMRQNALTTRCQQRLRALGVATSVYMADYLHENWLPASKLPDGPFWFEKLEPFVAGHEAGRSRENFECPRAPRHQRGFSRDSIGFGWNERFLPFRTLTSSILNDGETIMVADSLAGPEADTVLPATGQLRLDPRHLGKANVLFVAGNTASVTRADATFEWPRYWDRK